MLSKRYCDHVKEMRRCAYLRTVFAQTERKVRDRDDGNLNTAQNQCSLCVLNRTKAIEYYHNSSWLEYGGAPDKVMG